MTTTDRAVLAGDAYRDERHLEARQALYQWQTPIHDLPGRVVNQLRPVSGVVVDIGCGNGRYLERVRSARPELTVIGLDLSVGMMAGLARPLAVADVADLPVADDSAQAILALHMLYHVNDIDRGLREIVRALEPGGTVLVSTNARHDKTELDELWAAAAYRTIGVPSPPRVSLSRRFDLEVAEERLGRFFAEVVVEPYHSVISVPDPDPVIAHLASYRTWAAETGVPFDQTLANARAILDEHIAAHGSYRIRTAGGLLRCRLPWQG